MNKAFNKFTWQNEPSVDTPLSAENLMKLNNALDTVDSRVVTMDTTKLDKTTANTMVKDISFDEATGIFTVTKLNGSTFQIDTKLEKIIVNFRFDKNAQKLVIILDDGTEQEVDLSALVTQYEFKESDTIILSVDADGKVYGTIKKGSITGEMLEPNYLANVTEKADTATAKAQEAENSAIVAKEAETNAKASETTVKQAETNAINSANKAESYAVGGTGTRDGEDTDNAKFYSQSASSNAQSALSSANTATEKASEATTSATKAKESENIAVESATSAENSANTATTKANAAASSATSAANYAIGSINSAKYYYEQAKSISESISGTLKPMGTVTFANLPTLSSSTTGDMYNVSNEFTTTSDFKEGAGNVVPAGTNVYKTADGKWDILAGTPVTGVKGNAESSYRRGNINITPANIGAVPISGGTMTGNLVMQNLTLSDGVHVREVATIFDDGDGNTNYGSELVLSAWGNSFIGAGESPRQLRNYLNSGGDTVYSESYSPTQEQLYLVSDANIHLVVNADTVENRKTITINKAGQITTPASIMINNKEAEYLRYTLQNSLRNVQSAISSSGQYTIWDTTNDTAIIRSPLDGTNIFYGNITGSSETATKLAIARTIRTNLSNTSIAFFDGSADITLGVTGTLGISNGGTGATTAAGALSNLGTVPVVKDTTAPSDTTCVWIDTATKTIKLYLDGAWTTIKEVEETGVGYHNSVHRGKYLGTSVTEAQWAAIKAGTFEDLYIGDYWIINGIVWRIAAFDYYLNCGDTGCTAHHVVIVPDRALYSAQMNNTESGDYVAGDPANTTAGGYVGSDMRTQNLEKAKTIISEAFGEAHILKHRRLLSNAVTNGYTSGHAWYDSTVELMTERNVYGNSVFSNFLNGTNHSYNYTIDKTQFPLFAFRPDLITSTRVWYWLMDVATSSLFANVNGTGYADCNNASHAGGVRPDFSIYQA